MAISGTGNVNPSRINPQGLPKIIGDVATLVGDLSGAMTGPTTGGINMGPAADTITGANNIFAGSAQSQGCPCGQPGGSSAYGGSFAPAAVGAGTGMPAGGDIMSGLLALMASIVGLLQKLVGGLGGTSGATQPGGSTGGGGASTPSPSGVEACPGAGTTPAGGTTVPTEGVTPPVGGEATPTPAGLPGPYDPGQGGPTGAPGASPDPSGNMPTGTENPQTPAGSGKAPPFKGTGKVVWDKAPAFLKKWQKEIQGAAQRTGMPESLIAAMITDESSGNDKAMTTNPNPELQGDDAKDVSLMQVNGNTYKKEIQPKHRDLPSDSSARYRPDVNILAGSYYIADLPFNSWEAKLRAFNSGPAHVDPSNPDSIKKDEKGLAPGTQGYPTKIMNLVSRLEKGTLNW